MSNLVFLPEGWEDYLYWQRIDGTNRLIYRIQGNGNIEIAQCRGHYNDK